MPNLRQLYNQELDRCRHQFEQIDLAKERGYWLKFTTFSANVGNIMPSIPREDHARLFSELLLQQVFTAFDQQCLSAGDLVQWQGSPLPMGQANSPKIYCTYHLGSYRLLTSVLFRKGVDCVLLVGSNMNRSQGEGMTAHIEGLRQKYGLTNVFRVVETGNPAAGLTVLRELKAGRSLIVYVDGSPETEPKAGEEAQFLSVQFGSRQLLTRKGVGYLSHAAKVPIVPVVCYRRPDLSNVLHSLNPIHPDLKSDREAYCQEVMQQLYDAFWPYLQTYPGQWEGWNYIHLFLEPGIPQTNPTRHPDRRLTFNEVRYTVGDLEQAPILFDRQLYQTYEITADLRDLLLNLDVTKSLEELIGQEVLSELVHMEVLH